MREVKVSAATLEPALNTSKVYLAYSGMVMSTGTAAVLLDGEVDGVPSRAHP